jgi:oligopeptide/dipeptide ABC transporter ATP-binding protein
MRDLRKEFGTSIALISHDMGVIAGMCDRVLVMREGVFVETGHVEDIFYRPHHDYTKMLLGAVPRVDRTTRPGHAGLAPIVNREARQTLLDVQDLRVSFPVRTGGILVPRFRELRAVDGVSFSLKEGETLGIVGESGCGKSTLARAVLKLLPKDAGTVVWCARDIDEETAREIRELRKEFQIVFQDPLASLDPRMTIGQSIAEPLRSLLPHLPRSQVVERVRSAMERVGLDPILVNRYPHEFSGGQIQRVGIARAIIVEPKLVICDEAVSALDVSIQAQIVDLILQLQADLGMSLIFISHDLSVVRHVAHRVMVLFLGRVVEVAEGDAIYLDPRHPYTQALIAAVPVPDPKIERAKPRSLLTGDLPSPLDSRSSLTFMKSKAVDDPDAVQYVPRLIEVCRGHFVAEHDGM